MECSSHFKEYHMTELKLETTTEAPKPVEKIVEVVTPPAVEAPPAPATDTVKPVEDSKTE